jgi:pantoate--beta-alanine ligase
MVAKNNLSVNVVGCPIHRECNNLAMSSRKNAELRSRSGLIYAKTLAEVKEKFATNKYFSCLRMGQKRFKTILIYFRIFHYC